ncbi:unnamed protein product [Peniophora sp. CBMAI 1063]|nr:unnamed protein product [Peniophora sp. CBMAI 1063]
MSTEQTTPPTIREAGAPFADIDADIILRSSDSVDFRVHRLFLSKVSPIFADMFALPPGGTDAINGDEERSGIRVVKMPEDEKSLRILLGYCYLALEPVALNSLDDAERALVASDKYQLTRGHLFAMEKLKGFAKQDPERVYALGWRLRAVEVVRIGALESLVKPYTVELPSRQKAGDLPSSALLELLTYQRACIEAALGVMDMHWLEPHTIQIKSGEFAGRKPLGNIVQGFQQSHLVQEKCEPNGGMCRAAQEAESRRWRTDNGRNLHVYPSLYRCFDIIKTALKTHPRGIAIDHEALVQTAALTAFSTPRSAACEDCSKYQVATVAAFTRVIAQQVEKALAEVPLETPFWCRRLPALRWIALPQPIIADWRFLILGLINMPTDESMPPSIREAGAPFDAGDADIILRSSDNVDFRAHRLFLSKASPFFADMLSLPPGPTVDEEKDGIRVVNMSEDEESLRILVGYCYLALQPVVLDTLEDAERALRVADKFQLERARTRAVNKLRVFAKQEPERVYAFGWRLRSRDVVLAGALASLAKPYTVALPTLQGAEDLPSTILFKLLAYQKACIDAAQSVFDLSWLGLVQLRIESVEAAREYPFVRRALPDSTGHTIDQLNCMNRRRGLYLLRGSAVFGRSPFGSEAPPAGRGC